MRVPGFVRTLALGAAYAVLLGAVTVGVTVAVVSDSEPGAIRRFYPTDPGTTWVYETTNDGEPGGLSIDQITLAALLAPEDAPGGGPEPAMVLESSELAPGADRPTRTSMNHLSWRGDDLVLTGYRNSPDEGILTLVPALPLLKGPVVVGTEWSWEAAEEPIANFAEGSFEWAEMGTRSVAGRRVEGCALLRYRLVIVSGDQRVEQESDDWWCPGVGLVSREVTLPPDVGSAALIEHRLVAFRGHDGRLEDPQASVPPAPDPAPVEGSVPGIDQARSNHLETDLPLSLHSVDWTVSRTDGFLYPPIAVPDGVVVSEEDGSLWALDTETGEIRWRLKLPAPFTAPPVLAGGVILVAEPGKRLSAYDVDRGWLQWTADLPDVVSVAPLAMEEAALVVTDEPAVRALRLEDGSEVWAAELGDLVRLPPAAAGDLAVVADVSGATTAFDPANGEQVWSSSLEGALTAGPAVGHGLVLVTDDTNTLTAFDGGTGVLRWAARVVGVEVPLALAEDRVVVRTSRALEAFSLSDGELIWTSPFEHETGAGPVVAGRQVIAATSNARLFPFALADGAPGEPIGLAGPDQDARMSIEVPMGAAGGRLLVTTEAGNPWNLTTILAIGTGGEGASRGFGFRAEIRPNPTLVAGPPTIVGSDLFVPGNDALYRVGRDREVETVFDADGIVTFAIPVGDSVLVPDGTDLVAVRQRGGEEVWRVPAGQPLPGLTPAVTGGAVAVPGADQTLSLVDLETGAERWSYRSEGQSFGANVSPAILPNGDVVYGVGGLARVETDTGEPMWSVDTIIPFAVRAAGDDVLAMGFDSATSLQVVALHDGATGEQRWQTQVGWSLFGAPTVLADEGVAVITEGPSLRALDLSDGRERWARPIPGPTIGVPLPVDGGRVVALVQDGWSEDITQRDRRVVLYDASGTFKGSFEPFGSTVTPFPVAGVSEGRIVVPAILTGPIVLMLEPVAEVTT